MSKHHPKWEAKFHPKVIEFIDALVEARPGESFPIDVYAEGLQQVITGQYKRDTNPAVNREEITREAELVKRELEALGELYTLREARGDSNRTLSLGQIGEELDNVSDYYDWIAASLDKPLPVKKRPRGRPQGAIDPETWFWILAEMIASECGISDSKGFIINLATEGISEKGVDSKAKALREMMRTAPARLSKDDHKALLIKSVLTEMEIPIPN